jgi:predicted AlkP superfamily pyrophosphatase or phosphodiesterase
MKRLYRELLSLVVLLTPLCVAAEPDSNPGPAEKPKLVVMIAVDQLRRDRLAESTEGGLGQLLTGRNYVEGMLDHGVTNTCPGHVVMLTGAQPATAGVPGNSFIDRETFADRYCVDDQDEANRVIGGSDKRSPRNIRVDAFGDWLKAVSAGSRVFSVAGKDRAAIAMAGQQPDGVYWYHKDTGKFTSSGYYTEALPDYLRKFNGKQPEIDGHLSQLPERWEHAAGRYRPDDFPGEKEELSRTSGHPLISGAAPEIYEQVYRSPYLDQQTLAVASMLAKQEKLGQGEATDVLIVGLSATDTIGHGYGPRSAEAEDALAKLDGWLGSFLNELEQQVGKENLLVALSADHGVAELPEFLTAEERNSCPNQGRISVNSFVMSLYWNIYKEFSFPFNMPTKLVLFGGSAFTINTDEMRDAGIEESRLLNWLTAYLSEHEFVERAWTREELLTEQSDVARLLRNSFVPDRSGDVFVQLKQDCVLYPDGGTTHGSVYHYDREVPVVFYGWQVTPGQITGQAHSVDIGPTLAEHIGLVPPRRDGKVLDLRAAP